MGYHAPRKANPAVIRQIEAAIHKLNEAKREYENTALPNTFVENRLSQSAYVIQAVKRDLHYI